MEEKPGEFDTFVDPEEFFEIHRIFRWEPAWVRYNDYKGKTLDKPFKHDNLQEGKYYVFDGTKRKIGEYDFYVTEKTYTAYKIAKQSIMKLLWKDSLTSSEYNELPEFIKKYYIEEQERIHNNYSSTSYTLNRKKVLDSRSENEPEIIKNIARRYLLEQHTPKNISVYEPKSGWFTTKKGRNNYAVKRQSNVLKKKQNRNTKRGTKNENIEKTSVQQFYNHLRKEEDRDIKRKKTAELLARLQKYGFSYSDKYISHGLFNEPVVYMAVSINHPGLQTYKADKWEELLQYLDAFSAHGYKFREGYNGWGSAGQYGEGSWNPEEEASFVYETTGRSNKQGMEGWTCSEVEEEQEGYYADNAPVYEYQGYSSQSSRHWIPPHKLTVLKCTRPPLHGCPSVVLKKDWDSVLKCLNNKGNVKGGRKTRRNVRRI